MGYPRQVTIWEAGPRDGLQNERQVIATAQKVELIDRLVACGISHVEIGSFVSPKWVPQMADSSEVAQKIHRKQGIAYQTLTPNMKGLEAALAVGVDHIAIFGAASESFSQKNINCSIAESLERFKPVAAAAQARGIKVRGFVSCALGCPFEGAVSPGKVAEVTRALVEMGCTDVGVSDTIGVGTPRKVQDVLEACLNVVPREHIAVHFHDTYGQALANILRALDMGISIVDSAVAGLGGCPYAPGASGNVATEDVVYMLNGMGIDTGIDLDELVRTAWWISTVLGRTPTSRVAQALRRKVN